MRRHKRLEQNYPPSEPCACEICLGFCSRPGWWTVRQAKSVVAAGYANRMMLEIAPVHTFGVLSPAFFGCEGSIAQDYFSGLGCNFLRFNRCELFGSGLQPLECRYCHHDRPGMGPRCHANIEKDWQTTTGQALVIDWCKLTGLFDLLDRLGLEKLRSGCQGTARIRSDE